MCALPGYVFGCNGETVSLLRCSNVDGRLELVGWPWCDDARWGCQHRTLLWYLVVYSYMICVWWIRTVQNWCMRGSQSGGSFFCTVVRTTADHATWIFYAHSRIARAPFSKMSSCFPNINGRFFLGEGGVATTALCCVPLGLCFQYSTGRGTGGSVSVGVICLRSFCSGRRVVLVCHKLYIVYCNTGA